MDENGPPAAAIRQIRRAGQITIVNPVAVAVHVQKSADLEFRTRTMLPDPTESFGSPRVDDQPRARTVSFKLAGVGHASNDRTQRVTAHVGQVGFDRSEKSVRKAKLRRLRS